MSINRDELQVLLFNKENSNTVSISLTSNCPVPESAKYGYEIYYIVYSNDNTI